MKVERLFAALLFLLASAPAWAGDRPLVYVGIPPQRWLVQQLAGDRWEVGLLLGPGQNPHTFEPTSRQVKELVASRCYLMMGLPFERALVRQVQAVQPGFRVFDVTTNVPRRLPPEAHQHHAGDGDDRCGEGADPHIWLTPVAMTILASNTARVLEAQDPEGRAVCVVRLAELCGRLRQLDAALRTQLAPVRGGVMLTYHPSWGYFTDAYGLRQESIEAEGRTPAARQLAARIDRARQASVRRIFTEPPYDPRPAQTLARQIGAEVVVIDPLAEVWDDNLRAVAALVRSALPPAK